MKRKVRLSACGLDFKWVILIIGTQHYPLGSGKHHRTILISDAKVRSFKKTCNT